MAASHDPSSEGLPREVQVALALHQALKPFDGSAVAATAAALQLVPENTERILRLEVLALVGSGLPQSRVTPTPHRLRHVLNGPLTEPIAGLEDPFENPFTESICYHGGSYVVLPGPSGGVATRLRYVLRAVHLPDAPFPRPFVRAAAELATACLSISDIVAGRAALPRVKGVPDAAHQVLVPPAAELARLRAAVFFEAGDLHALLQSRHIQPDTLGRITRPLGTFAPSAASIDGNPMLMYPLVSTPTGYVVALPTALCDAAISGILQLAMEHECQAALEAAFRSAVWQDVEQSLAILRHEPITVNFAATVARPTLRWGFYAFDTDKVACVLLKADTQPLPTPNGGVEPDQMIQEHLSEMQQAALQLAPVPNDLLFLVVGQVAERTGWLALSASPELIGPPEIVTAEALAKIALFEKGDRLAMWKYQRALELQRAKTLMSPSMFGDLNDFYYYSKVGRHGYYISDEAQPHFLTFMGGGSGRLRQEIALNEDRHGVIGPNPDHVTEVTRAADEYVYVPRRMARRGYHVEVPQLPLWIVAESDDATADSYAEALAYWLSLFREELTPFTRTTPHYCLCVSLDSVSAPHDGKQPEEFINYEVNSHGGIRLEIRSGFDRQLWGRANKAERALVRVTLAAILQVLGAGPGADETIELWMARRMPGGSSKRLTPVDLDQYPEADSRGLPRVRLVQEADEQVVLDEVGVHLRSVFGLVTGPLSPSAVNPTIQSTVGFLFARLEAVVATLAPASLLEWLLGHNEILVSRDVFEQISLPGRVSCVRDRPGLVETLAKTASDIATASISTRFLIEYVAARPPRGLRPISWSVFDILLAYAKYIHVFGTLGDVVHFGISPVSLGMLGSGRLGIDNDAYGRALGLFTQSAAELRVLRALDVDELAVTKERVPDELVKAGLKETLGQDPSKVAAMIRAIADAGTDVSPSAPHLDLAQAVGHASAKTGANPDDVLSAIKCFTLEEREAFLKPHAPHRREDTYPWRFGRELSLLQRPFIIRKRGGAEELVWGPRQLSTAMTYRQSRVAHGSFEPRSAAGRQVLGRITEARGDLFEVQVRRTVEQRGPSLLHAARVRKANGRRLVTSDGRDLGDIDVLVANPVRRRLWLLECKDLSPAVTPWRLRGELDNMFAGDSSIQRKHEARVTWARVRASAHGDRRKRSNVITENGPWRSPKTASRSPKTAIPIT